MTQELFTNILTALFGERYFIDRPSEWAYGMIRFRVGSYEQEALVEVNQDNQCLVFDVIRFENTNKEELRGIIFGIVKAFCLTAYINKEDENNYDAFCIKFEDISNGKDKSYD